MSARAPSVGTASVAHSTFTASASLAGRGASAAVGALYDARPAPRESSRPRRAVAAAPTARQVASDASAARTVRASCAAPGALRAARRGARAPPAPPGALLVAPRRRNASAAARIVYDRRQASAVEGSAPDSVSARVPASMFRRWAVRCAPRDGSSLQTPRQARGRPCFARRQLRSCCRSHRVGRARSALGRGRCCKAAAREPDQVVVSVHAA